MEAFGNTCIRHSLAPIEQQPQKYRGLLPSGRDTGEPPLNSWADKTHHTEPAGCKASWNVEVFAVAWVQHHLDRNQRVLQAWASRDTGAVETEAVGLRQAIPDADQDTIELHGGRETADHSSPTGHDRHLEDRGLYPRCLTRATSRLLAGRRFRAKSIRSDSTSDASIRNRSVKPWSPSAVRVRHSEQKRRITCDCRHLQPRPGPSHHGLTERLHPFTARRVHRNPVQNGRCNEGNGSAMERVSYLYK